VCRDSHFVKLAPVTLQQSGETLLHRQGSPAYRTEGARVIAVLAEKLSVNQETLHHPIESGDIRRLSRQQCSQGGGLGHRCMGEPASRWMHRPTLSGTSHGIMRYTQKGTFEASVHIARVARNDPVVPEGWYCSGR
jgi:hypothetical protein